MYVKMFQSIYDGSLATRGPWQALVTFQQMLVLCDKDGVVDMTPEVISRRTTIPLDIVTKGLAILEQPDPESRRAEEEGRRIVRIAENRAWGWQIVNYAHYRAIRTADERREYMKAYMREKRARVPEGGTKPRRPGAQDSGDLIESIPLNDGSEFQVLASFVAELDRLYPAVEPKQTLREIRGWCLGNPTKRKTARGVRAFITAWFGREQDKHSKGNGGGNGRT